MDPEGASDPQERQVKRRFSDQWCTIRRMAAGRTGENQISMIMYQPCTPGELKLMTIYHLIQSW